MRAINVAQKLSSPQACARRIQAALIDLESEELAESEIYLGRDPDEALLRRALAASRSEAPVVLHAVGHQGIGRRTFIRNSLQRLYPRYYQVFPEVSLGQYQGIDDLFRSIYSLHVGATLTQALADFEAFARLDHPQQCLRIAEMVKAMSAQGELLFVLDDNAVLQESGDYQPYIAEVVGHLSGLKRPALVFVQSRMMPMSVRVRYRAFHHQLQQLSDSATLELLALTLQQLDIDYSSSELAQVADLVDGHPFNVRFAAEFILNYGLQSLLDDPSDLVEWKRRRGEDFLQRITFGDLEGDIFAILSEYRHLSTEAVSNVLDASPDTVAQALRRLQEYCCVELNSRYFSVSAALRDAVSRDKRFFRSPEWKQEIGRRICLLVEDYSGDDDAPLQLIDTATLAAARGQEAPAFLSQLILPSHLLSIARDHYDGSRRADCIIFCKRAYAAKGRLPPDAQIEALRLWGLSAARAGLKDEYGYVIDELKNYHSDYGRRTRLFVEGLSNRLGGRLDQAERCFLEANRLARNNLSTNRELAALYSKQGLYVEAEPYARAAYQLAPTNPYIIDVLADVLIGKESQGLKVSNDEVDSVLDALQLYGNAPGVSFFAIRQAQSRLQAGDLTGALGHVDRAIAQKNDLATPYFMRIQIFLRLGDTYRARQDLNKIRSLLQGSGGLSEGDEARAAEAEINISIADGHLSEALRRLQACKDLPVRMRGRIEKDLARAIRFSGSKDAQLSTWLSGLRP